MESAPAPDSVRVEVLGPLRLVVGGSIVDVPGPKRRAALALLALAEGRTLTVDALVRGIWPDNDTQPGRQAVHTIVSRLRSHLGAGASRLHTVPGGYRLELDDELDLARARELLARAKACAPHDPDEALDVLCQADQLWRGPALADLGDLLELSLAATEARRLHAEVIEALIEMSVMVGRASEILARAVAHLGDDPLREQAALALMRVLAADGSAAGSLQVSREFRERLADETGLDPSPALGELEGQIARGTLVGNASTAPLVVTATTPIFGRDTEVRQLRDLLDRERLVALTGPGGVGKTRVAFEVVANHGDAVVVLLAPVTEAASIPHALAAALGLSVARGDILEACLALLADRAGLLVIDNCEHVLDAARDVAHTLLTRCPGVRVLATSREPLGLTVERVVRLKPLAVPRRDEDPRETPAVQVFLDRAARVRPDLPSTTDEMQVVADLVRRLDGVPLAIELAAGRLSTISLPDIHARLDRALDLLGDGRTSGDARHRTLRATLEWSYQLLGDPEQRLFRHLAVFADGFDLRTAEQIAAALSLSGDPAVVLARLVDASMVQLDSTTPPRYRMLETLRLFGRDRLIDAGEETRALRLLVRWARDVAICAGSELMSDDEARADALVRRELGNLRAAWRAARDQGCDAEAAEIVVALFDVIAYRDLIEVREWAAQLADTPTVATLPRAAAVLGTAAEAAYHGGDHDRAVRLALQGLDLAQHPGERWYCLVPLAVVALARGEHRSVVSYALEAAELGRRPDETLALAALATAYGGDLAGARGLLAGAPSATAPTQRAWRDYVDGEIASLAGERAAADMHYRRSLDGARTSGATFLVGIANVGLLSVRVASGDLTESLGGYREVVAHFARTGNWTHLWVTLRNLARLLREHGDQVTADLIEDAAAAAPDAPADDRSADRPPPTWLPGRDVVLAAASAAIERLIPVRTIDRHTTPT